MKTPAEYFEIIIRKKAALLGYGVTIDHMQDKPDKMIILINGKGRLNPRALNGAQTQFDLVEVHIRGLDYVEASAVLPTLWEDVLQTTRLTSAYGKIVQSISPANTMGCLGQEPQNRRWRFSQNFYITVI
jgi:hypothetical protein